MKALLAIMLTIWPLMMSLASDEKTKPMDDGDGDVKRESYQSPLIGSESVHFVDHFDNVEKSRQKWIISQAKKDGIENEEMAKYDGIWNWESPLDIVFDTQDKGLVLKSRAKHAAISAQLDKQFDFKANRPLVVQYEVTMQDGQECGGSYLKLLSAGHETADLTKFNDKTPYTIMFGPDKCGSKMKVHFIFRHVNPLNGTISEKHCNKPRERMDEPFTDKQPHLYQLVVYPDNSFEMRIDHKMFNVGNLLTDFKPPVNPPAELDDPTDRRPHDWDDREKIPDPLAKKPDDWDENAPAELIDQSVQMPENWLEDEPALIPDAAAKKPNDWDATIDGEWEPPLVENPVCQTAAGCGPWKAPLINNPAHKGKWRPPMIENPNFQGIWSPRKIPNPHFFEDLNPFHDLTPISAVGLELWSMSPDILFDNLIITDDPQVARDFAAQSFDLKRSYRNTETDSLAHKLLDLAKTNRLAWLIGTAAILLLVAVGGYYGLVGKAKKKSTFIPKKAAAKKNDNLVQPADDSQPLPKADVKEEKEEETQQMKKKKKEKSFEETKSSKLDKTRILLAENSESNSSSDSDSEANVTQLEMEIDPVATKAAGRTVRKRTVRKD